MSRSSCLGLATDMQIFKRFWRWVRSFFPGNLSYTEDSGNGMPTPDAMPLMMTDHFTKAREMGVTPGGRHQWIESRWGRIRKPI